ncbi:MAG: GNAT family N-acetyltransferase [Myxococcales bacterium]|nr:GNAT family N-acetyltransferase [Myxococcales bacterium]MCB9581418.1 GNAT family N-acetyltransferase [Polyangiaceae bacterium]
MIVEIRALRPEDDRASFRSGDEALDLFFHRYAGQNQFRHHIGVTYVAVADGSVLGFATVSPATLDAEGVPGKRRLPPYPVPLLRIARLATHEAARGAGIGKALMRHCIELAERMREEVGCVGILVDAKSEAAPSYERLGFIEVSCVEGASHVVPRPTPVFLPLAAVPPPRR